MCTVHWKKSCWTGVLLFNSAYEKPERPNISFNVHTQIHENWLRPWGNCFFIISLVYSSNAVPWGLVKVFNCEHIFNLVRKEMSSEVKCLKLDIKCLPVSWFQVKSSIKVLKSTVQWTFKVKNSWSRFIGITFQQCLLVFECELHF